jgi:hypothetical protein
MADQVNALLTPQEPQRFPSEKRKKIFDAAKKLKEGSNKPPLNRCMYWLENCSDPIGSHSLSKCWLDTITFQGHVVKVKAWTRKGKDDKQELIFSPELFGWNEVSVFQGFCNKHDTELFRNLDSLKLEPTVQDCMTLIYRSVAREVAVKHHVVSVFLEQEMGHDSKAFQTNVFPQMAFTMRLLEYKLQIESALASGEFTDYEHLVFDLAARPPFLGATTFMPLVTSRARVIGANPNVMTLTLLPSENGGLAVLSWSKVNGSCAAKFAQALRRTPLHLVGMALARILFEISDNVAFSPVYWYGVPERCKQAIVHMHARSIVNHEDVPPKDALVPNAETDQPFALSVLGFRVLS